MEKANFAGFYCVNCREYRPIERRPDLRCSIDVGNGYYCSAPCRHAKERLCTSCGDEPVAIDPITRFASKYCSSRCLAVANASLPVSEQEAAEKSEHRAAEACEEKIATIAEAKANRHCCEFGQACRNCQLVYKFEEMRKIYFGIDFKFYCSVRCRDAKEKLCVSCCRTAVWIDPKTQHVSSYCSQECCYKHNSMLPRAAPAAAAAAPVE
ncbi:MAG: hypothetical protein Harvfovirus41_2 [Harvfovirus sp.]|uniref:Uncharacterized protein n=1 Tax=Harvfovirus sp. TaxID=2487768 RepID=A0A3G5A2V1_9VIRU|nr:MAG: hypothetical protein Harvfovirus41_2 [Harvfovirus sp.]